MTSAPSRDQSLARAREWSSHYLEELKQEIDDGLKIVAPFPRQASDADGVLKNAA